MVDIKDFASEHKPTWCPGCGDYGILNSVKAALASLNIAPHQVLIVSGIGCGSKLPDYMHVNGYMTLHGRTLPIATGIKLANHGLHVLVVHGDGDGYGIGMGHFMHTIRRNVGLVDLVQDNKIYGLTKGQYSPTSDKGLITSTSPEGAIERGVNPLAYALAAGATFVARGFSLDIKHLAQLIARAIQHHGYALVDILQPCVTFNKINTYDWYRQRVYKLDEEPGYDPTNKALAWEKVQEWEERIPIGVIYQVPGVPTYEDQVPALAAGPLVAQPLDGRVHDYEALKEEFM
jgi:2-oxoglutarate ferredoxin oxidoreductase subunit beta